MFVGCLVADESENLNILCEVGMNEAQLSDKNREVPRGEVALQVITPSGWGTAGPYVHLHAGPRHCSTAASPRHVSSRSF